MEHNKVKLRVKFTKEDLLRFISHLDLVNLFCRAIRRANIPIEYSGGYNPRPKIGFSFALPLGMISLSEYADFIFLEKLEEKFFIESLSKELPEGMRLLNANYVPLNFPSLTSTLNLAKYEVIIGQGDCPLFWGLSQVKDKIDKFMNSPDKNVLHRSKKGIKKIDISDIIKDINLIQDEDDAEGIADAESIANVVITMQLKISAKKNIRPQEILAAILNISEKDILRWSFTRTELSIE